MFTFDSIIALSSKMKVMNMYLCTSWFNINRKQAIATQVRFYPNFNHCCCEFSPEQTKNQVIL